MTADSTAFDVLAAITRTDGLLLHSDAAAVGLAHELRRAYARGQILRLRSGVYLSAALWATLDATERYRCRIRAYAVISPEPPVFSHHSAAALWGLPRPATWPTDVHITVPQASGGRSRHGVMRHAVERQPQIVVRDGLQVRFDDAVGFIAFVDFFRRLIGKVGEFDGRGEYLEEGFTGGLRPFSE